MRVSIKNPLKPASLLLASILVVSALPGFAAMYWIEGEAAQFKKVYPNAGFRILETGGKTWQIERTDATVTINNAILKRARALDANLMPAAVLETKREGGALSLRLPEDALYVLLESSAKPW